MKTVGDRRQVWLGQAAKTKHGLTRSDMKLNKKGKLVSKKLSQWAKKKSNLGKHLEKKRAKSRK